MTFIVIEIHCATHLVEEGEELSIIAHVKTTQQAIEIQSDMAANNPDRKFVWMMLGKAK